ncbi:recombinase family protein [uncultured Roseibium sp.]|uniref:recombinase family protein n=1 Tax=uncultured Roseibium sp. TaxID=1936171 RepID=UPI002618D687|nr:recombinase family protein [uncultured Roseibium sp.]
MSKNDQVVGQSFTEDGREIRVFGYARVSTEDQNLDMQIRALEEYGCFKIFQEKRSAYATVRPELEKMKLFIQEDDTVVVWKLDRLGRSVSELIELMSYFDKYRVNFVSLRDMIDTRTAIGKFIFHIMASLAQFERDLTSERTIAGMEAAKARGWKPGPPTLVDKLKDKDPERLEDLLKDVQDPLMSWRKLQKKYGYSVATLRRHFEDLRKSALDELAAEDESK